MAEAEVLVHRRNGSLPCRALHGLADTRPISGELNLSVHVADISFLIFQTFLQHRIQTSIFCYLWGIIHRKKIFSWARIFNYFFMLAALYFASLTNVTLMAAIQMIKSIKMFIPLKQLPVHSKSY